MTNKRIGVIPDIHERQQIAHDLIRFLFDEERVDEIVLLGDYFDTFDKKAVEEEEFYFSWLSNVFADERVIPLLGNHDIHYMTSEGKYACSGFAPRKVQLMDKWFGHYGNRFPKRFIYPIQLEDGEVLLFSHAGIHTGMLNPMADITKAETFDKLNESMVSEFMLGRYDSRIGPGRLRGGWERKGGVVWQDWREFEVIDGLTQIVGHTIGEEARWRFSDDGNSISFNVCIDTEMSHYAVVEVFDGEAVVSVKERR